jgi:hypothetical protein
MLNWILVLALVVVVLAIVALKKAGKKAPVTFPYQSHERLMSEAERSFLRVVDRLVVGRYRVFSKVRVADILKVKGGIPSSERQRAFNRISRKHVDFLITRQKDLGFVGAIELDDRSHAEKDRQERDRFIDSAFQTAGIPIPPYYRPAGLRPGRGAAGHDGNLETGSGTCQSSTSATRFPRQTGTSGSSTRRSGENLPEMRPPPGETGGQKGQECRSEFLGVFGFSEMPVRCETVIFSRRRI